VWILAWCADQRVIAARQGSVAIHSQRHRLRHAPACGLIEELKVEG
jgi:hypothetical protein